MNPKKSLRIATGPSLASQLEHTSSSPIALGLGAVDLAEALNQIHGPVRVARENTGLHFYIACPDCLEENGVAELFKKHLAINVDRYLDGHNRACLCMKHGGVYSIPELTAMLPLSDRGIEYKPEVAPAVAGPNMDFLEADEQGRWVPKNPGRCVPLVDLPQEHPALVYLSRRKPPFSPEPLWRHMQASYCEEENPDLFYRKQPGGFRVTPQGRLIFFTYQKGIRVSWQARILEVDDNDQRYFFHPYKRQWVQVLDKHEGKWVPREGYEDWDMAKYFTAPGTRRNSMLFGFDAAVAYNDSVGFTRPGQRWCILCEGPLDIGRLGPPAIGLTGKFLSNDQALLLEANFSRVVLLTDNDEAGQKACEKSKACLGLRDIKVFTQPLPGQIKDPGDLTPLNARFLFNMAKRLAFST